MATTAQTVIARITTTTATTMPMIAPIASPPPPLPPSPHSPPQHPIPDHYNFIITKQYDIFYSYVINMHSAYIITIYIASTIFYQKNNDGHFVTIMFIVATGYS